MAFLRVSGEPIYLRERIEAPDVVIVLDPTLLGMVDVTEGLAPGGTVVINANADKAASLEALSQCYTVVAVDAGRIAMETLGVPITNTAIIGALARATDIVGLDALEEPIEKRFGRLAEKNLAAMRTAFKETLVITAGIKGGDCDMSPLPAWEDYVRGEALHPWQSVEIGCDVHRPGSCREFLTGNWRTAGRPVMDRDQCIACGMCWIMCPDLAFQPVGSEGYDWDERYCKGCGICVRACPRNALTMEVAI